MYLIQVSYHSELLIKLPHTDILMLVPQGLSDLLNWLTIIIDVCVYVCVCFFFLHVCLPCQGAALKLLGTPASRSLIYFLYICLKP